MALKEYRAKRSLDQTPEPAGGQPAGGPLRFVVQKHAATRLHYDFRLELDGVLKSWAVPKGPSLNPHDKRLAMMVEDHPFDYRNFEGIIPKGNYGAGSVMIWDQGSYTDADGDDDRAEAERKLKAGLHKGDLKFRLNGEKLKGDFVLAKIKSAEDNAWLLIKHRDQFAAETDVTKQDRSVVSERSLEQIAASTEAWLPGVDLADAPKANPPKTVKPMLATLAEAPFDNPNWIYEIKWDGYRILAHLKAGTVRLMSRNDQNYNDIFRPIHDELAKLQFDAVLDGEVVVLDSEGRPDFGALQEYQKTGRGNLVYCVFDAPYALGHDLTGLELWRRRSVAAKLIENLSLVKFSDSVSGHGQEFFNLAKEQQLEGIMAKDSFSPYLAGKRSPSWLKIKTHQRQEAVIGGWTEPRGSRQHLGALVLGVYEDGQLRHIGQTSGRLSERGLKQLYDQLKPLEVKQSPFATEIKNDTPIHWVKPKLLAEVTFREWTRDGIMRQPVFMGLRSDKDAKNVKREEAITMTQDQSTKPAVELSNPDKIFFPKDKITKGDLFNYYDEIAETILPYLKDRPESLNRHPNGITGDSFYQKDLEKHPDWIKTVPLYSESNDKDINWLVANDADTLTYMINLGCIELNPWLSRTMQPDHPDWCLLDIDAKTNQFGDVIKVARAVHDLLEELKVPNFAKTSGKTGLHIAIPLGAKYTYEQSKLLAEILLRRVNQRLPQLTSLDRKPDKRQGQIYLDFLQNRKGQTMAAPYCVRPVPGAPVSTPLDWKEVKSGLDPTKFTIKTIQKRLNKDAQLWAPVLGKGIDLRALLARLS